MEFNIYQSKYWKFKSVCNEKGTTKEMKNIWDQINAPTTTGERVQRYKEVMSTFNKKIEENSDK